MNWEKYIFRWGKRNEPIENSVHTAEFLVKGPENIYF